MVSKVSEGRESFHFTMTTAMTIAFFGFHLFTEPYRSKKGCTLVETGLLEVSTFSQDLVGCGVVAS